jgi:hypothetical protein
VFVVVVVSHRYRHLTICCCTFFIYLTNTKKKNIIQSNVEIPAEAVVTEVVEQPSQSASPPLPGRDDCPLFEPDNLSNCDDIEGVRCSYYDNITEPQAAGITNCDCTKDEGFRCRPATAFVFSF